jgi:hypothetical protein
VSAVTRRQGPPSRGRCPTEKYSAPWPRSSTPASTETRPRTLRRVTRSPAPLRRSESDTRERSVHRRPAPRARTGPGAPPPRPVVDPQRERDQGADAFATEGLLPVEGAHDLRDGGRGIPDAQSAPMDAPMLVPATQSTRRPSRSRTSRRPMWARPRAPPPLRTRPILGRPTAVSRPGPRHSAAAGAAIRSSAGRSFQEDGHRALGTRFVFQHTSGLAVPGRLTRVRRASTPVRRLSDRPLTPRWWWSRVRNRWTRGPPSVRSSGRPGP